MLPSHLAVVAAGFTLDTADISAATAALNFLQVASLAETPRSRTRQSAYVALVRALG
jgi:hypothetical protein